MAGQATRRNTVRLAPTSFEAALNSSPALPAALHRPPRVYRCRCGNSLFFRNTQCLKCQSQLGYLPLQATLRALDPGPQPDTWIADRQAGPYKGCANRNGPAACNWLLDAGDARTLCLACGLNRTIPSLDNADNARYWGLIERAKRRLVADLLGLGLPVRSRLTDDPAHGLMFDFLRPSAGGPKVLTGHDEGLITLDIEEADDAQRERIRQQMHEPYRTLLGHLRHEVGHYYWDRLVRDGPWLEPYRALFGDERAGYAAALQAHYANGPPPDWPDRFISSYASSHPWEDWAETWAHYLHMSDSLGTATDFGLQATLLQDRSDTFGRDTLYDPQDAQADAFLAMLNGWVEMTMVLNELARSLGQRDFYPFVMSRPVVAKLQFVHMVARAAAG